MPTSTMPLILPPDKQQDLQRTLPDETKTIDLNTYLKALKSIGYDGGDHG